MKNIILLFALILLCMQNLSAKVIKVPDDKPTIQDGIDETVTGDTVLVQPNTYIENINFGGKKIVVASLFLTTQDTGYISQTVIDGNQSGSVVVFNSDEDLTAKLCGFTIYNGSGTVNSFGNAYGGGIFIDHASPQITHLTITQNRADEGAGIACQYSNSIITYNRIAHNTADPYWGGGMVCESFGGIISNNIIENNQADAGGGLEIYMDSSPLMSNNIVRNNQAVSMGGGIILYTRCSPIMDNNLICDNEAPAGGAIFLHLDSNPIIVNSTFSHNTASSGGGIYMRYYSHPVLINSILWNNDASEEIYCNDSNGVNTVTISYSDIDGGQSNIVNGDVNWLGENINSDPLFVDPAAGDYHLSEDSPCIDSGDTLQVYNDVEDPMKPGYALYPSLGSVRNDMGIYGGPIAAGWHETISSGVRDEMTGMPGQYVLEQNYPNPFNPATTISYIIQKAGSVTLKVYDVRGREIRTLVSDFQSPGVYHCYFGGEGLASGVYVYRLQVGRDFLKTKKMTLLR